MSESADLSWTRKLLFAAVTTLGLALIVEVGLALVGVKATRDWKDPFVGFDTGVPLFVRDGDRFSTNPAKRSFFNIQEFSATKDDDAYRIFCLGGSTTFGRPYDQRTAFPNWLRAYLEDADPERDWQVVNAGGISYASYRLALLTGELCRHDPDLFVIYSGHNEFLEERTYAEVRDRSPIVKQAIDLASRSRSGSLIARAWDGWRRRPAAREILPAEVKTILEQTAGPQTYRRDDALRRRVLAHYRDSIERIVREAAACGARVILVRPASNLRDFSPFKSESSDLPPLDLERWGTLYDGGRERLESGDPARAAELLAAAAEIDGRHADTQYLLGRARLAAGSGETARGAFERAVEEDVCPLRALAPIGDILREIAAERDLELIDYPEVLVARAGERAPYGILGAESFLDHVHPTIEAHARLGRVLFETLGRLGVVDMNADDGDRDPRVRRTVLSGVDRRDHGWALYKLAMTLAWAGKDEEALRSIDSALDLLPDEPEIRSLRGRLLDKTGRAGDALSQLRHAVEQDPENPLALARLAEHYGRNGRYEDACPLLLRAIERTPEHAPAGLRAGLEVRLGACHRMRGDVAAARERFERALAIDPSDDAARRHLDSLETGRNP